MLNNKTIKSFTDTFIITNNDIFIKDGIIDCFPQNYDSEAYCLLLNGGNGIINNVTINTKSNGGGVMENPTTAICIKSHSILNIENSTFNGVDENNGSISNVYVEELCELNCINTKFEATSPNGMSANIFSQGDIILSSCDVQCYANHTANAAGTNYATLSRAIYSVKGNVKLFDCQIYGTHSGLTIRDGELYVDGGTYDGYSHGGIYFGSNNTKNYIYNASVNDTPIRGEGMYDDGVAGTNGGPVV